MYSISETLRRCEAMIVSGAPRLMRCGGIGRDDVVRRKYTEAEKAALVERVRNSPHRRVRDVAAELGVHAGTAQGWVRKAGGKGGRASRVDVMRPGTLDKIKRALELRARGMTMRAIAAEMGVWPGSVSYLLSKGGV